jgi:hypothetical protein
VRTDKPAAKLILISVTYCDVTLQEADRNFAFAAYTDITHCFGCFFCFWHLYSEIPYDLIEIVLCCICRFQQDQHEPLQSTLISLCCQYFILNVHMLTFMWAGIVIISVAGDTLHRVLEFFAGSS